jgi:tRNA G26 N,N-dimethylase Trm1
MTCTDMASICGHQPQVALRFYGCKTNRNVEFHKELGARVVIASAVRAAAKCNKGLEVLSVFGAEHFVHILCKVTRGGKKRKFAAILRIISKSGRRCY